LLISYSRFKGLILIILALWNIKGRCYFLYLKRYIRQNNSHVLFCYKIFMIKVIPKVQLKISLHFIGHVHFVLQGWHKNIKETRNKRFLCNKFFFCAFECAKKAIANDSWQLSEFKKRHIVDVYLILICFGRMTSDSNIIKKVFKVTLSDLFFELLVLNWVIIFNKKSVADWSSAAITTVNVTKGRWVCVNIYLIIVPHRRRKILVHLNLAFLD